MTRTLYRALLRLYPRAFRERYQDELLETFTQARTCRRSGPLFADTFRSLLRQWVRTARGPAPSPRSSGLSFYTAPSRAIGAAVLLPGVILAGAAFGLVGIAIVNGAPSGTMQLPRVLTASPNAPLPRRAPRIGRAGALHVGSLEGLFRSLDVDGDGKLSYAELRRIVDPRLRRKLTLADVNVDGYITRDEARRWGKSLREVMSH